MTRHVFPSDFDGFLYFHGEDVIPGHGSIYRKPLREFWVDQILLRDTIRQDTEIVVASFSARSYSVKAEIDNATRNKTPLSLHVLEHRVLPELAAMLNEKGFVGIKVKFDPITLADFNYKFSHGKTAQILRSFFDEQGVFRGDITRQQESLFFCNSKLPLLYFLAHYFGQDGKETIMYVGDDRLDILAFIEEIALRCPELFPANVKIVPYRYAPSITGKPTDFYADFNRRSIQGTGPINTLLGSLLNPAYMHRFVTISGCFEKTCSVTEATQLLEDSLEKIVVNLIGNEDGFLKILAFINNACDSLQHRHERFKVASFQQRLALFFLIFPLFNNQNFRDMVDICISNITAEAIDGLVILFNKLTSAHDDMMQIVALLDKVTVTGYPQACAGNLTVLSVRFFNAIEKLKAERCKEESRRVANGVVRQLKKVTLDAAAYIVFQELESIRKSLSNLCKRLGVNPAEFIYGEVINFLDDLLMDGLEGFCEKSRVDSFLAQLIIRVSTSKINPDIFLLKEEIVVNVIKKVNGWFDDVIGLMRQLQCYLNGLKVSASSMSFAASATLQTEAVPSLIQSASVGHAGSAASLVTPLAISSQISLLSRSEFGASGQKYGKS